MIQDEGTDAETRRQIARESDKIRREMERERRAKSMSPGRERSPTRTYLTLTQSPKVCCLINYYIILYIPYHAMPCHPYHVIYS